MDGNGRDRVMACGPKRVISLIAEVVRTSEEVTLSAHPLELPLQPLSSWWYSEVEQYPGLQSEVELAACAPYQEVC
jgi:hypothetical protein